MLAALVHSLFVAALLIQLIPGTESIAMTSLHVIALVGGYLVSIVIGFMGLARRGLVRCAWALLLMPLYWLMLSVAAWRALYQLLRDPYRWEKTEHGLAKTSRLAGREPAAAGFSPRPRLVSLKKQVADGGTTSPPRRWRHNARHWDAMLGLL